MNIVPFAFGDHLVRTAGTPEAPLFCGKDVCAVLGIQQHRSTLALLPDDERGVHTVDSLGGPQEMTFITEAGLYRLIFRSRKAEAEKFRRWVFTEVLPAIRQTGRYAVPTVDGPARYVLPVVSDEWLAEVVPWTGRAAEELVALLMRRCEVEEGTARLLLREAMALGKLVSGGKGWSEEMLFRGTQLSGTRLLGPGMDYYDHLVRTRMAACQEAISLRMAAQCGRANPPLS